MRARAGHLLSLAASAAVVLAACGKTGGTPPMAGVYHLPGAAEATSLELRADGTFTLRRDSCVSSGVLSCGDWTSAPTGGKLVAVPGSYWPTPDDFPSAVVRRVSLAGLGKGKELLVVGESEWAGTFTERWAPGRACPVCVSRVSATGETTVVSSVQACAEPMPACARVSL